MTARSGRPEALMPTVAPPARNPPGIAARRSTGGSPVGGASEGVVGAAQRVGHGASGSCSRPAVSGSPKATLNAWIAWPAAPFTRLSMTDEHEDATGPLVEPDVDPGVVAPADVLRRRRRIDHVDERLVVVGGARTARRARPGRRSGSAGRGRTRGCPGSSG